MSGPKTTEEMTFYDRARALIQRLKSESEPGIFLSPARVEYLVAQAIREAAEAEREACLQIFENGFENNWVVQDVIDAIRARSTK